MRDEEHPALNNNGSLLALDRQAPNANSPRDVFLYDRASGRDITPAGMNDPAKPETFAHLDATGNYVSFLFDNAAIRLFERKRGRFVNLPADRPFDTRSELVAYLEASKFKASAKRFSFVLTTKANVRIKVERRVRGGGKKKVGTIVRRDRINGTNKIKFNGVVAKKQLAPGSYRATLTADAGKRGERSKKRYASFTVR